MWFKSAAIVAALAVAIGAFGAHALPSFLEKQELDDSVIAEREATYETGARYHMYHALALLVCAREYRKSRAATVSRWAMLAGITLFSGCLYANALTGIKWLGAIVPLGGISFIVGWIALALTPFGSPTSTE